MKYDPLPALMLHCIRFLLESGFIPPITKTTTILPSLTIMCCYSEENKNTGWQPVLSVSECYCSPRLVVAKSLIRKCQHPFKDTKTKKDT